MATQLEDAPVLIDKTLKRLTKRATSTDNVKAKKAGKQSGADDGAEPAPKPKTGGLKLKIKFNGAYLTSKSTTPAPTVSRIPAPEQAELDALGLPENQWRKPLPAAWKQFRGKPLQPTQKVVPPQPDTSEPVQAEASETPAGRSHLDLADTSTAAVASTREVEHPGEKAQSTAYQIQSVSTQARLADSATAKPNAPECEPAAQAANTVFDDRDQIGAGPLKKRKADGEPAALAYNMAAKPTLDASLEESLVERSLAGATALETRATATEAVAGAIQELNVHRRDVEAVQTSARQGVEPPVGGPMLQPDAKRSQSALDQDGAAFNGPQNSNVNRAQGVEASTRQHLSGSKDLVVELTPPGEAANAVKQARGRDICLGQAEDASVPAQISTQQADKVSQSSASSVAEKAALHSNVAVPPAPAEGQQTKRKSPDSASEDVEIHRAKSAKTDHIPPHIASGTASKNVAATLLTELPSSQLRPLPVRESGEISNASPALARNAPESVDRSTVRGAQKMENVAGTDRVSFQINGNKKLVNVGEADSDSNTSSSSSESSSGSDSDSRDSSRDSRRGKALREAGERSDSDSHRERRYARHLSRSRHHQRHRRSRSRSMDRRRHRSPSLQELRERRDRERERDREDDRYRRLDEDRMYGRSERERERLRERERERRHRDDSRYRSRYERRPEDSERRDREKRRSPSAEPRHAADDRRESLAKSGALPRTASIGGNKIKADADARFAVKDPAQRDMSHPELPPLPPDEPSQPSAPAQPSSLGFADAWKMLHGSVNEDWGGEANIDELHNAATAAKHTIDNISKATNGKHTFENLVALMRESYLKYMQVCAIWEGIAKLPNAPPNRNRAKLADDGGMYPGTIGLMRHVASECKTCPANTEASLLLRILTERLMAIMQMRVAQVQRPKLHHDKQFLLSCQGAPKVDFFGRKVPGQETPGETYQRPSPTDSNASNNTSEQAVTVPAHILQRGVPKSPASAQHRAAVLPKQPAGKPLGVRGGKVQKQQEASKPAPTKRGKTSAPTLGREDAWAVHPPAWEIPPAMFEHELRSWSILGGVIQYTANLRNHAIEIQNLMQSSSPLIKEAAAMLAFLDLGLGMSNIGSALKMSHTILDLILKIQQSVSNPPLPVS